MDLLYKIYVLIFGAFIGSFLNVVIYRLPFKKSVVTPRSSCPTCGFKIPWYLNVPIFSFLFLRAKCFQCQSKISWRYPIIELITAIVAALLFPNVLNPITLFEFVFHFTIFCILLCHLFIDLDHFLLLDSLNIYLLLFILPYAIFFHHPQYWLLGGAIGFFMPFLVTWIFYKVRGKVGLGGGDIKLWGVLGILIGPQSIIMNIFLSCFVGAIVGLILMAAKRMKTDTPMPFGPFIIIVSLIQIFFPHLLTNLNNLLF